eukprot:TRINITY_DN42213_c0_g1_i1.p1 TRINITY_DN42213_c0_g1~~TRINITY_DN42213_c0_g1_i1.p1  ORF type:complete len:420 (-),score=89.98 TRINITY_DN42213_c0_g1_i1:448-1686(-)
MQTPASQTSGRACVHDRLRLQREQTELREQQIQALCQEYYALESQFQQLSGQHEPLKRENAALQAEIRALQQMNAQQCSRITELEAALASSKKELLDEKVRTLHLHEIQSQRDDLERANNDSIVARDQLQLQYAELQAFTRQVQTERGQFEQERSGLKLDFDRQLEHNRRLVRSHDQLQTQLERKEKELAQAQAKIVGCEQEIAELRNKTQRLAHSLEHRDQAFNTASASFKSTATEVSKLRRECSKLQKDAEQAFLTVQERDALLGEVRRENARLLGALFAYANRYHDTQTWVQACSDSHGPACTGCPACGAAVALSAGTGVQLPAQHFHAPPLQRQAEPTTVNHSKRATYSPPPGSDSDAHSDIGGLQESDLRKGKDSQLLQALQSQNLALLKQLVDSVQLLQRAIKHDA